MTISSDYSPKSYKPGSAMAAEAIPWHFRDAADIVVTHVSAATGIRTVLPSSSYTIAGSGTAKTGTIQALGEYPADDDWIVERATSARQTAHLPVQQPLSSADVEGQLDRMALVAQERIATESDLNARSLQVKPGQAIPPFDLAAFIGKLLAVSAAGLLIPASGTGADAALRTDLALPDGGENVGYQPDLDDAEIVDVGEALQSVRSIMDFVPKSLRADIRRGTSLTNMAPYFAKAYAAGVTDIELPRGRFRFTSKPPIDAAGSWRGAGSYSTLLWVDMDDWLVETSEAAVQRLGLHGLQVYGDTDAHPNCGGFKLFDPSTADIDDCYFHHLNKPALHFVQAVRVGLFRVETYRAGYGAGQAAIYFDNGATSSVQVSLRSSYFAGASIALKGLLVRNLLVDDCVFESNAVTLDLNSSDGLLGNSWLEANGDDGTLTDCGNMIVDPSFQSTAAGAARLKIAWSGAATNQRGVVTRQRAHGELYHDGTIAAVPAAWTPISHGNTGKCYYVIPAPGGISSELQVERSGVYAVDFEASLRESAGDAAAGALRLAVNSGSGWVEVEGSARTRSLPANQTEGLQGRKLVYLAAGTRVRSEFTATSGAVYVDGTTYISGAPAVMAAATYSRSAMLRIEHMGVIE